MQAFTFRLQTLLEQKLDSEAKAKVAVAEKQQSLHEQKTLLIRLEENERRIERSILRAREELLPVSVANTAADVQRRNDYLLALRQDLSAAKQQTLIQRFAVEEAEMHVNEAQAYALECFRESEKLSRYREKLERRFLAEAAKKEELEQDEIGTTMHVSRRAGT
jgi:flagellar biosynthesis chaperone FliJ